jgi:hypothetical protein
MRKGIEAAWDRLAGGNLPAARQSVRFLLLATIARIFDEAPPHFIGIPAAGTRGFDHCIDADVRRLRGSYGSAELVGVGSGSSTDQLAHDRFDYGAHKNGVGVGVQRGSDEKNVPMVFPTKRSKRAQFSICKRSAIAQENFQLEDARQGWKVGSASSIMSKLSHRPRWRRVILAARFHQSGWKINFSR